MPNTLNAAPMVNDHGINDKSFRTLPPSPLEVPQHLPVHHIFASKGPVGSNFMDFSNATLEGTYGTGAMTVGSPFHNASSEHLRRSAANGNNCIVRRVHASDINDRANLTLGLDVLEVSVPLYVKNSDGSVKLDDDGLPVEVVDGSGSPVTTPGYKVFWYAKHESVLLGEYDPGKQTQKPGIQNEGSNQSIQYPLYEFAAATPGSDGNKLGVKLWPHLTTDIEPFPSHLLEDSGMFPFNFSLIEMRDPVTGQVNPVPNSFGSTQVTVTSKSNTVTDLKRAVTEQYVKGNPNSGLGTVYVYEKNLKDLLGKFLTSEIAVDDDHKDPVLDIQDLDFEKDIFAFNFLSFTSSNGSPYQSVKLVESESSVRLTRNTNIFLEGGSDGTMDFETFERLVAADMQDYGDPLHEYSDLVLNPESIIYDVGYSVETKKAMCNFIALRKDTFAVFSTFLNGSHLSIEEQFSLGISIKSMVELYPESSYYGTAAARALIMAGSGTIINSDYQERVPLSYDLLDKAGAFMGNSQGRWVEGKMFDHGDAAVIRTVENIDIRFVPASTRTKFWSAGINFPLNFKVDQKFFPALKTVYENDTSILTSFFNVMAACYLNKIGHHIWRMFTGSVSMTTPQFISSVNAAFAEEARDRFNGIITVLPNAVVTSYDDARGFSWTLNVRMGGNNSRTVQALTIEAYRAEDLADMA